MRMNENEGINEWMKMIKWRRFNENDWMKIIECKWLNENECMKMN